MPLASPTGSEAASQLTSSWTYTESEMISELCTFSDVQQSLSGCWRRLGMHHFHHGTTSGCISPPLHPFQGLRAMLLWLKLLNFRRVHMYRVKLPSKRGFLYTFVLNLNFPELHSRLGLSPDLLLIFSFTIPDSFTQLLPILASALKQIYNWNWTICWND